MHTPSRRQAVLGASAAALGLRVTPRAFAYQATPSAALKMMPGDGAVAIVLAHDDPALTLPLAVTDEADEAFAEWHSWAEALGLPLLVEDRVGFRKASPLLGELAACRPRPRRRRRSSLKARRPSILLRRMVGRMTDATPVHQGEREIIARD